MGVGAVQGAAVGSTVSPSDRLPRLEWREAAVLAARFQTAWAASSLLCGLSACSGGPFVWSRSSPQTHQLAGAAALAYEWLYLRPLAPAPVGPPETGVEEPRPGDTAAS